MESKKQTIYEKYTKGKPQSEALKRAKHNYYLKLKQKKKQNKIDANIESNRIESVLKDAIKNAMRAAKEMDIDQLSIPEPENN